MFCMKIRSQLKALLSEFDTYVDGHIDTALNIAVSLKNVLSSPEADIITAIIPGNAEAVLKQQLVNGLTKAIEALTIAENCKQCTTVADKVNCFVQQIKQVDPHLQDAILIKLASLIAGFLDGGRLKQSLYDLYTQAKYSVTK
jgi:hypothetical protein